MTDLTPDHPAVEAAARVALKNGWTCDTHEPEEWGVCPDCTASHLRTAHRALTAALPYLTGDEPEAPADLVTPPPVLHIPSQVGARVHLYPRGYEIDPEAHGLRSVYPPTSCAAVLVITSPDHRTGHPVTAVRYLSTHHARQLGQALIAAADYADQGDAQ